MMKLLYVTDNKNHLRGKKVGDNIENPVKVYSTLENAREGLSKDTSLNFNVYIIEMPEEIIFEAEGTSLLGKFNIVKIQSLLLSVDVNNEKPFPAKSPLFFKSPQEGLKTKFMYHQLAKVQGAEVDEDGTKIDEYLILNRTITNFNQKLASIGSVGLGREIILLNPEDNKLKEKYLELKNLLDKITDTEKILQIVGKFVRINLVYDDKQVEAICQERLKSAPHEVIRSYNDQIAPKISLSHFLTAKLGVCRHQALFAGYLLYRLMEDKILQQGDLHHHRANIKGGGHTWLIYVCKEENSLYSFDATNKVIFVINIENLEANKDALRNLTNLYGKEAVKEILQSYLTINYDVKEKDNFIFKP